MLELGELEGEAHTGIGVIAGRNVDRLYLIGTRMANYAVAGAALAGMSPESVLCCSSHEEIAVRLQQSLAEGDVILFKGSRGMAMEKVAAELKKLMQPAKGE
jgi:UDP-N-acetylmuramoyl-tripeptide--D-alanyl-D-alanine ligase